MNLLAARKKLMRAKGLVGYDETLQGKEKAAKGILPHLELGLLILWSSTACGITAHQ